MHIDTNELARAIAGGESPNLVAFKLGSSDLTETMIGLKSITTDAKNLATGDKMWIVHNNKELAHSESNILVLKLKLTRELFMHDGMIPTIVILNRSLALKLHQYLSMVPNISWQGLTLLAMLFAEQIQITIQNLNNSIAKYTKITIYRIGNTHISQNELSIVDGGSIQPTDILTIIYKLKVDAVRRRQIRKICEKLERIMTLQLDGDIHKLTVDENPLDHSIVTESRPVVVIFFPHNPAYRRTGAHQLIILRVLAMLELGATITFISTVAFTDTKWDDWSIDYMMSLGISRVEVIQDAIVDIEHRSVKYETWSSRYFETYTPPYLTLRVKQILSEVKPDCFYINYAYWAELSNVNKEIGSRNVLDLHDFLGRSIKLSKDATNTGNSLANLLPAETLAFTKIDKIIAVSLPDFNQLKSIYRSDALFYLPVAPKTKPRHTNISTNTKRRFVFVGSNNNINITSMMRFINEALPLILSLNSEFELQLYGSICEYVPKVKGINACGWQPEEIIYKMNTVLVSPLISSTGMQVKIAEAFCNAAPVICYSSIALQNDVVDGFNGIVAHTPDALSKACLRLERDDDLFQRCQNGAEETSIRRYEHFRSSLNDILFETEVAR